MPLVETSSEVPEIITTLDECRAGIIKLNSRKEFSPKHTLDFSIYKTTLYEAGLSSTLFPLVVAMWEQKERDSLNDFYSFDNNGICLSHGYKRWKDGKLVVNEAHDNDLTRLIEYGEIIQEMIGDYPIPSQLATHTTVIDLRGNTLKDR